jgi:hypothetical protein
VGFNIFSSPSCFFSPTEGESSYKTNGPPHAPNFLIFHPPLPRRLQPLQKPITRAIPKCKAHSLEGHPIDEMCDDFNTNTETEPKRAVTSAIAAGDKEIKTKKSKTMNSRPPLYSLFLST